MKASLSASFPHTSLPPHVAALMRATDVISGSLTLLFNLHFRDNGLSWFLR